MGGAELLRPCQLAVDHVDGEDRRRAGDARALDNADAHAAAAEHDDAGARLDLGGVDRGSDSRHHSAAEQRRDVVRNVLVYLHRTLLDEDQLLGERARAGHPEHRCGADLEVGVAERIDHVCHAELVLSADTVLAHAALR